MGDCNIILKYRTETWGEKAIIESEEGQKIGKTWSKDGKIIVSQHIFFLQTGTEAEILVSYL